MLPSQVAVDEQDDADSRHWSGEEKEAARQSFHEGLSRDPV